MAALVDAFEVGFGGIQKGRPAGDHVARLKFYKSGRLKIAIRPGGYEWCARYSVEVVELFI